MDNNKKILLTQSQIDKLADRKRPIKIPENKNESRKIRKNSGLPYISTSGFPVPGKLPAEGKACSNKCNKPGCFFDPQLKKEIFTQFHADGNLDQQTTFLLSCVKRELPNYADYDENHRRANTFRYYLPRGGENHEVCQISLMDILKVKQKRIRIIQAKLLQGIILGNDMRGKHHNRPHKLDAFTLDPINEHINSFPTVLSHYKRNLGDPLTRYLPHGLNLSKMFDLYKVANRENIRAPFLKDAYSKQFKKSGLRFAKLRSDTCSICEKLFVAQVAATPGQMADIQEQSNRHHEEADTAYVKLRQDSTASVNNPTIVNICVDCQQILLSPTLEHKEVFYMRQFSSYNYCIYNTGTDEATMCYWNETLATRGSEEMLSCLWKYITNNFAPLVGNEQRTLILWSDRCCGQNNNYVTLAFGKLLIFRKYFTNVQQKFLCSGHSFLPCDRMFALIEKQKRICKVYHPDEWLNVFKNARPSKPFSTISMAREDFLAFDELLKIVPKPVTLKVSEVLWIQMSNEDVSGIFTKPSHDDDIAFTRHEIFEPYHDGTRYSSRPSWNEEWLHMMTYSERNSELLPIDAKKYSDLQKMVDFILPEYRDFYKNLPHL